MNSTNDHIINVRIRQETKLKMDEISHTTGVPASSIVRAAIGRLIDKVYDEDGNLMNLSLVEKSNSIALTEGYFPVIQVSRAINVHVDTIKYWAEKNKIKSMRSGRLLLVKLGDVIKYERG